MIKQGEFCIHKFFDHTTTNFYASFIAYEQLIGEEGGKKVIVYVQKIISKKKENIKLVSS